VLAREIVVLNHENTTGFEFLVNDIHLRFSNPNLWHEEVE
jgi:hypothetical protein